MPAAGQGRSTSPCGETTPEPEGFLGPQSRRQPPDPVPGPAPCPGRGCASPAPSVPAARRPSSRCRCPHRCRPGSASAAGHPRSAAARQAVPWPAPCATGRRAAAPPCRRRAPSATATTSAIPSRLPSAAPRRYSPAVRRHRRPRPHHRRAAAAPRWADIASRAAANGAAAPHRRPAPAPAPQPRRLLPQRRPTAGAGGGPGARRAAPVRPAAPGAFGTAAAVTWRGYSDAAGQSENQSGSSCTNQAQPWPRSAASGVLSAQLRVLESSGGSRQDPREQPGLGPRTAAPHQGELSALVLWHRSAGYRETPQVH